MHLPGGSHDSHPGHDRLLAGQEQEETAWKVLSFSVETCAACPLRPQCIKTKVNRGRAVQLHPQEELLQQARAFQNSPEFQPYRQIRQTAEHRLALLVQLGIRQARYFGRRKTLFQLLMAAMVANLTLIAEKKGKQGAVLSIWFNISGGSLPLQLQKSRFSAELLG